MKTQNIKLIKIENHVNKIEITILRDNEWIILYINLKLDMNYNNNYNIMTR